MKPKFEFWPQMHVLDVWYDVSPYDLQAIPEGTDVCEWLRSQFPATEWRIAKKVL